MEVWGQQVCAILTNAESDAAGPLSCWKLDVITQQLVSDWVPRETWEISETDTHIYTYHRMRTGLSDAATQTFNSAASLFPTKASP